MDAQKIRTTEGRGRLYDSVLDTVGNTPVIRINNLSPEGVTIYVKAEFFNPAALGEFPGPARRGGHLQVGRAASEPGVQPLIRRRGALRPALAQAAGTGRRIGHPPGCSFRCGR